MSVDANESSLLDHFALFGIPRKLSIDAKKLEARFHTLQMASHPDKFSGSDPKAAELAEDTSATINKAYRVLREPIARLRYLLGLYGYSVVSSKAVPQSLLMSVMEAQESIGEYESALTPQKKENAGVALAALSTGLDAKLSAITDSRKKLSTEWDSTSDHAQSRDQLSERDKSTLDQLVKLLAERAYIETLSASIRNTLAGESSMVRH